LFRLLALPFHIALQCADRIVERWRYQGLALMLAGLALGWWLYVPLHELAHAFACLWSGGAVSRLELEPLYGGEILARWFDFVAPGSDYAGQLTGFDTRGSDAIYLATVLGPYLLTVFPGVPVLAWAAQVVPDRLSSVAAGAGLPWALAPFLSLPGDMYEAGSIAVTALAAAARPGLDIDRWRSDDVFLLLQTLATGGLSPADAGVVAASLLVGLVIACLIFGAGWLLAQRLWPGPRAN
jgi:hypothetical protein